MKKKFVIPIVVISLLLTLFVGYTLGYGAGRVDNFLAPRIEKGLFNRDRGRPQGLDFSLFWDAWEKVHQKYVGEIDDQELLYGAIEGMVAGVGDPYSVFLTPEESTRFLDDLDGSFGGIGVELGIRAGKLTVIAPLEGSPAEKAGIRAKDIIIKVDDKDIGEMTFDEAVEAIRGREGTEVKLTVKRKNRDEFLEFEIVRAMIEVKNVKYEIKDGNIGYISVSQFGSDTTSLFEAVAERVKRERPKGLILDLRNNPGGFLEGAVEIASFFVEDGVVVYEKEKNGDLKEYKAKGKAELKGFPLVVLINEGSASGAEIVAGAIKDYGLGKLIGARTFGKGSVQELVGLPGDSNLRITVAHWLTPMKREIDNQGIEPEIQIGLTDQDVEAGRDPQLKRAIEELNK